MPHPPQSVLLGGHFALPSGLLCVRCGHPLTYGTESLACERCDTIYELLERYPLPDSCPHCAGPVAWMGGALMCSPVPHPSCCSQGFVAAPPAVPRVAACCGRTLPWSNRASLCFPCALRAYVDIRPTATRIYGADGATDDDWRAIVGFALADDLWATSGPVAEYPDYGTEFYAVGTASATYLEGQLVCVLPPWVPGGGPAGTVWLVRVCCPSGIIYEVAFPAGCLGEEAAGVDQRGRRGAPLPERIINTRGLAGTRIQRELGVARKIVNALPRNLGGQEPIDPKTDVEIVISAIQKIQANGDEPNKSRVGRLIYPDAQDPRDSLKKQLARIRERAGWEWDDLLRIALNR